MTAIEPSPRAADPPRWDLSDIHPSLESRSFSDAQERSTAQVARLVALFDELGIGAGEERRPTEEDGLATDRAIEAYNTAADELAVLESFVHAAVATDSRNQLAQSRLSELQTVGARLRPLLARLADWVAALDVDRLAAVSPQAHEHLGPLRRLAARSDHQMSTLEEDLYAELATTGSAAWQRLQRDLTSQLTAEVALPDGPSRLPMAVVRGLATDPDAGVRRAAHEAEMVAWPTVEVPVAAAMNAIKGEANTVDRRRSWSSPLEASLFANSVSLQTFDAMSSAVASALPDLRRWMRRKALLHGHGPDRGLPWWDLVAPLPIASAEVGWDEGLSVVRSAFDRYDPSLADLVDRAVDERWIDAEPRDGKRDGAFCRRLTDGRSLVFLNWSGSADSTQTAAHELGHAFHNVALAERTALQRRLPMALAETASIFCETLVVDAGLASVDPARRLALLDVDLQGATQVIVDIHSRFLFESEVFARRARRTLGADELCGLMNDAQAAAYGDGLDQTTAHPYMWLLKPHYYGSHFYNWPYTYGLLFGLGLFAEYRRDPERFRDGYADLLSRAGMETAEALAAGFGLDVTDETFWVSSLDVVRARISEHARLADELDP